MRGPRYLKLGAQLVAHQLMGGLVAERNAESVADPLAHLSVGGKALRLRQGLLEESDLVGLQGRGFARRDVKFKQGDQATLGIALQPAPNGVTVDTKTGGNIATETSLTAGKQIERMEALPRSEEHTSELQSRQYLVCRL